MAKTSKTTKRSTTTKNTKKKGLSRINFSSRKTQLLTVAVIVAVMGGVWFTYRSFAGSNAAQIGAAQLDPSPTTETKSSTGKSGQRVARLSPGESISWTINGNYLQPGSSRRLCATVRYENPSSSSKPAQLAMTVQQKQGARLTLGGTNFTDLRYATLANSYSKECARWFTMWGRDDARFIIRNNGPSTARVGVLLIERP